MMTRGLPALALLAVAALLPAVPPAAAGDEARMGAHYSWKFHGDCPEAAELVKVADAAWVQFSAYFNARPSGKPEIEYWEKPADYTYTLTNKAGKEDGAVPVQGRYFHDDKKVYQPRQERAWDTRQWLIANLAQQFMVLGVFAKGKQVPAWYQVGIAYRFALHRWDGKTLVTGVEDDPGPAGRSIAQYADQAKAGKWDPMDGVSMDTKTYVEGWTAVQFLLSGADKAALARFKALERKMWDGMESKEASTALLGPDGARIRKAAREWILALPRPWIPVADAWERISADCFAAVPSDKDRGATLLCGTDPGPAPFIEATIVPAEKGEGDLLVGFTEATGGLLVAWSPGSKIELLKQAGPDRGRVLASADGPPGAEARLRVEIAGTVVRVLLAGKEVLTWTAEGDAAPGAGRTGLRCIGGSVRFIGVKFSEARPAKK